MFGMWRDEPGETRQPRQEATHLFESTKPSWVTVYAEDDQYKLIVIDENGAYSVVWLHSNPRTCSMHRGEFPDGNFLLETEVGETWEALAPLPRNSERRVEGFFPSGTLIALHKQWGHEFVYVTVRDDGQLLWLRPYNYIMHKEWSIGDGYESDTFARIRTFPFIDGWYNVVGISRDQQPYVVDHATDN